MFEQLLALRHPSDIGDQTHDLTLPLYIFRTTVLHIIKYDMIYDMIRYVTIRYIWCDTIYDIYDMIRYVTIRYIWCDTIYDIYDMIRYDTIWYDTYKIVAQCFYQLLFRHVSSSACAPSRWLPTDGRKYSFTCACTAVPCRPFWGKDHNSNAKCYVTE